MEIENKDPKCWKAAQKRAGFTYHVFIHLPVIIFFWTLWYINSPSFAERGTFPWPLWPLFGWGIGVLFNYPGVYTSTNHLAGKGI
ncbi:MAG: 2TM domain-containing protein [Ginsengibacter sp.]